MKKNKNNNLKKKTLLKFKYKQYLNNLVLVIEKGAGLKFEMQISKPCEERFQKLQQITLTVTYQ
jgi:hypothetical protein